MRIIAHTEKAPGSPENEDSLVITGGLVGVLDGVTAPKLDTGCMHGPAWYVRNLATHLTAAATADPSGRLEDYLASAIRLVTKAHAGTCDVANPHTPASTISLLRQRGDQLEYLMLCDSPIVLETAGGAVSVIVDTRFEAAVAELRLIFHDPDVPIGSREHAERVHRLARHKETLINQPHGYWIPSSNPDAAYQALTGSFSLMGPEAITRAALLTDGASRAVELFELLTWPALLDTIATQGPAALIAQVRAAELADLYGSANPRHKRHDDATAVLCLFDHHG